MHVYFLALDDGGNIRYYERVCLRIMIKIWLKEWVRYGFYEYLYKVEDTELSFMRRQLFLKKTYLSLCARCVVKYSFMNMSSISIWSQIFWIIQWHSHSFCLVTFNTLLHNNVHNKAGTVLVHVKRQVLLNSFYSIWSY